MQVFLSNPRGWAGPRTDTDRVESFLSRWRGSGLGPLVVHAPYLVNIASPNREFLRKSRDLVRSTLAACEAFGAEFLVVHAGAGGPGEPAEALERAATSLRGVILDAVSARVVVELMAGTSGAVASTIGEAERLFREVASEELRLCLDTCHLFASGYAIDSETGIDAVFTELRETSLLDSLVLIHANDSKFGRGERRDRHENIGDGRIGVGGFGVLLTRPELSDVTVILETPGDAERKARDIGLLRRLVR